MKGEYGAICGEGDIMRDRILRVAITGHWLFFLTMRITARDQASVKATLPRPANRTDHGEMLFDGENSGDVVRACSRCEAQVSMLFTVDIFSIAANTQLPAPTIAVMMKLETM